MINIWVLGVQLAYLVTFHTITVMENTVFPVEGLVTGMTIIKQDLYCICSGKDSGVILKKHNT